MYTIKHAAALTGISVDTLRMWERRYGVVAPVRGPNGYRRYDDAAVARLTAMRALVAAGWAPRDAAAQVTSGTTLGPEPGPRDDSSDRTLDEPREPAADLDLLVDLAGELDAERLGQTLEQLFAGHDLRDLVDAWLMPALRRLGLAWQGGTISVAAEHFVSAGVQSRLSTELDSVVAQPGAPRVLVGLASGCRHELGVLAFALLLRRAGLDVTYLGADVPSDSWAVVVTTLRPDAVVLGVHSLSDVPAVRDAVAVLRAANPDPAVLLGGSYQEAVGAGEPLGHSLTAAATTLAERYGTQ